MTLGSKFIIQSEVNNILNVKAPELEKYDDDVKNVILALCIRQRLVYSNSIHGDSIVDNFMTVY